MKRTGIFFKNKLDTAPRVYTMPFYSLEYVCLLENFLEEIKFLLEKIHQIFSYGSQGRVGKGKGVKKPCADLSAVYLTVMEEQYGQGNEDGQE